MIANWKEQLTAQALKSAQPRISNDEGLNLVTTHNVVL
jgi:hypothetical protein